MDFFYGPGTCALAAHIALVEAGANARLHRIDFSKGEQNSADYLAINPKGRVPALITDRGTLTETPAILAYLAQTFPTAKIAPVSDPFAFAQVQAFNSYLCSTLHVAHAHKMRGHRWTDDEAAKTALTRYVPTSVTAAFAYVEHEVFVGPYVLGSDYSIADMYLFTVARWMEGDGVDPSAFPKVIGHRSMMVERPAVRAAMEAEGLNA